MDNCEFIPDAYNEIINAEKNGLITVLRYNEFIDDVKRKEWLERVITDEYRKNKAHPDYRFFSKAEIFCYYKQKCLTDSCQNYGVFCGCFLFTKFSVY